MSDQNVKAAQKYLNAMFGGHKDWVKLDEDGKTGTAVMQGSFVHFRFRMESQRLQERLDHLLLIP